MRRVTLIALPAALMLLSGCSKVLHHWRGWPFNNNPITDGPSHAPRPSSEPVYSPDSDSAKGSDEKS